MSDELKPTYTVNPPTTKNELEQVTSNHIAREVTPTEALRLLSEPKQVFVRLCGYTYHRKDGDPNFYYFADGPYPECLRTTALPDLDHLVTAAVNCGFSWRVIPLSEIQASNPQ